MASTTAVLRVALLLLLPLLASLGGVRPVPQPVTSGCTTELLRLLPCLPFINGAEAMPSEMCCTNLGSMAHDVPQCLCQALSQPGTSPVAVNMSRVLGMPRLCRLDIPSAAADACRGPVPQGPAPPAPVIPPRPNANSTVPSTLSPATPTAPHVTPSPLVSGRTPAGYSSGSKVIVYRLSVALGSAVAVVSVLAF